MPIYNVKTTASQEQTVADMIMNREEEAVHAALAPDSLTSYVMVEADDAAWTASSSRFMIMSATVCSWLAVVLTL